MQYANESFDRAYREQFMFGASCAPYALGEDLPREEWEPDLLRMKEMGFNTVRIFAAWSRIEVREDRYDFAAVDAFFELAEKHGMKVILNFGGMFGSACGCGRPWYLRDRESFCHDDPYIEEREERFLRRAIERYRGQASLVGWMTWNEPNNMEHCRCAHTLRYFRGWLRDKYGSVDALDRAWAGGEPVCFESFDEITGPAGQGIAARLDWERFQQWNLQRRMLRIHDLVQELDPQRRFTVANIVHHLAATEGPENSMTYGLNLEQMGQAMSMMGVSVYISEHRYDPQPPWKAAYKLARMRSVSCDARRRTLVLETGTGPNIGQLSPDGRDALLWQMIAHNVKGMLMWNYRSRVDGGQVALHHMMAFDGSVTERGAAIAAQNAVFQRNAALLNRVCPVPEAAVLTLEDSMLLQGINYGIGSIHSALDYERVQGSRFGAYKLLWDMKIGADLVTESGLERLDRYKVLLLPAQEQVTPALAEALRAYAAGGGTILAEGPMGFRNEEGRLICRAPGYGLDEVFGCRINDRQKSAVAPGIVLPDGSRVPVCDFFSVLYPTAAEVLCRYDGKGGLDMRGADGVPGAALTVNRFGKGMVICAGTEIFRQYAAEPQAALTALLRELILASGIRPDLDLEGDTEDVEAARLAGEGDMPVLYLVINHTDTAKRLRIRLRDGEAGAADLTDGAEYGPVFEKTLQPKQTLAFSVMGAR